MEKAKSAITIITLLAILCGCVSDEERVRRAEADRSALILKNHQESRKRLEEYWCRLALHNYNMIRAYIRANEDRNRNADLARMVVWLNPSNPIGNISAEDKLKGEAKINEFGSRYMPQKFADYEKAKERYFVAYETFKEEFGGQLNVLSDPDKLSKQDAEIRDSIAYNKIFFDVLLVVNQRRVEWRRLHDEFIHLFLMHKLGSLTVDELATIDSEKRAIWLLEKNPGVKFHGTKHPESDQIDFASKYMPESFKVYEHIRRQEQQLSSLYDQLWEDARAMDLTRYDNALTSAYKALCVMRSALSRIHGQWKVLAVKHRLGSVTAAQLANDDSKLVQSHRLIDKKIDSLAVELSRGPFVGNGELLRKWHLSALGFNYKGWVSVDLRTDDDREFFNCAEPDSNWGLSGKCFDTVTFGELLLSLHPNGIGTNLVPMDWGLWHSDSPWNNCGDVLRVHKFEYKGGGSVDCDWSRGPDSDKLAWKKKILEEEIGYMCISQPSFLIERLSYFKSGDRAILNTPSILAVRMQDVLNCSGIESKNDWIEVAFSFEKEKIQKFLSYEYYKVIIENMKGKK